MKATDGEMARIVTGSLLLLILTLVRSEESPVEGAVGTIKEKLQEIGANTQNKRAAVGGVLGFGAGMMIKQTQNMIITAGLLGGAATAGACYVGLVKPEDVEAKAGALLRKAFLKASRALHPDRMHDLPTPRRAEAEEVFKVLTAKYHALEAVA